MVITDSRNLYDKLQQTMLTIKGAEKRTDLEAMCLRDAIDTSNLDIRWVSGDAQLANSLTKGSEPQQYDLFLRMQHQWRIVYDPGMTSGRKRKQAGLGALEGSSSSNQPNNTISLPPEGMATNVGDEPRLELHPSSANGHEVGV